MKKIIIYLVSIFLTISLYGQTREVKSHNFFYKGSYTKLIDHPDFKTDKFRIGWHWAAARTMSKNLNFNFIHCTIDDMGHLPPYYSNAYALTDVEDSAYMIINSSIIGYHWSKYYPAWSMSYQYEPTLLIDSNNTLAFNKRLYDTTHPIFGFENIHGYVPPQSNENYNRLIIDDSYNNSIILSNNWPNNYLKHTGEIKNGMGDTLWTDPFNIVNILDTLQVKEYNGNEFYISINLRRLNTGDITSNDDKLLAIVLPFENLPGSGGTIKGIIKFDSLPSLNYGDTINLPNNRGVARILIPSVLDTFYITRNMIPRGNESERDITISAHFKLDYLLPTNNYGLKGYPGRPSAETIDKIKIEVTKLAASSSLAIDWIRIETRSARDLFRSYWDNTLINKMQTDLDTITNPAGPWAAKGLKPYRWYLVDEPDIYNSFRWGPHRYVNTLLGNVCTHEVFNQIQQYDYYLDIAEKWIGLWKFELLTPVPFTRSIADGQDKWQHLGYKSSWLNYNDTLNAEYETASVANIATLRQMTIPNYLNTMATFDATQNNIERNIYSNYVDTNKNPFLYSGINWLSQSQILSEWSMEKGNLADTNWHLRYAVTRAYTGEDVRYFMNNSLLMGARGLNYDGEYSQDVKEVLDYYKTYYPDNIFFSRVMTRIGHGQQYYDALSYNNLSADDFLAKDDIGSDFLSFQHDSTHLNLYIDSSIVCNALRIPGNRLYLGRKSIRTEMKKTHDWVRANEKTLMNSALSCWYGVGYHLFYTQHPRYGTDTILKKFIKYDGIRTKKLFQPVWNAGNTVPTNYENFLQSFFDVTIHSIGSDTLMSNSYMLAVQNRRVSPLFFYRDTARSLSYVKFLSTAEMEKLCNVGGKDPENLAGDSLPASHWRSYYDKQFAWRELTIPMQIKDSTKKIYYKVEELTDGTAYSPSLSWCKKEEIKNRVNITLKQSDTLKIKLMPGQAKLFKVTIIEDNTTTINGELAFSNQTKFLGYAKNQNSDSSFYMIGQDMHFYQDDSLYFHITYHRTNLVNSLSKVYYRRSLTPYKKNIDPRIIQWGPENLVSNVITLKQFHDWRLTDSINKTAGIDISCKYPAMVIRYNDSLNCQCAYIVYTCSYGDRPDSVRCLITETVFPSNFVLTPNIPQRVIPIAIAYLFNPNVNGIDDFGHVSINASKSGNYYAFSDSLYGICAAWKTARNRGYLTNRTYLRYNPGVSSKCYHPCLNTYSRLSSLEDDCALVWQENTYGLQNIIYTRLFHTGNTVTYSIPNFDTNSTPLYSNAVPNTPRNMAKINDVAGTLPELPIVYRPVEFAARPGNDSLDRTRYNSSIWDRVYWQAIDISGYKSLYLKNVDINEYTNCWYILPQKRIFAPGAYLAQPNVSQGCVSPNIYSNYWDLVGRDSTLVLSFIKYPNSIPTYATSTVYQIDHHLWFNHEEPDSQQYEPNKDYTTVDNYITSLGTGMYPHLARIPAVVKNDDWFLNRRVFQSTGNQIKTTAQIFLKEGVETQKTSYPLISISNMKSGKTTTISDFYLDDVSSPMIVRKTKSQFADVKDGRIIYKDKIFTNWFKISEINNMNFFTTKNDSNIIKFEIERKSDGKKFNMSIKSNKSEQPSFNKLVLINGKNDLYRIVMNYDKKTCLITEELMISDPIDFMRTDTLSDKHLSKSDVSNEQYIDLGGSEINTSNEITINAYPNPSDNAIYVSYNLPLYLYTNRFNEAYKTEIILYSMNGQIITKKEAAPGEIIPLPTSDLPTGAYFLKAVFNNLNSSDYNNLQGFKTVIVQH